MWEYVKGSEADFEGAPDEATVLIGGYKLMGRYWAECFRPDAKYKNCNIKGRLDGALKNIHTDGEIIAERRKVDDLQSRTNDANLQQGFNTVQRPAHYNQSGIECIDAIAAAVKGKSGIEAALVSNVIKYLWRYELKNGVEDVRKAQWYLDRLVKELNK